MVDVQQLEEEQTDSLPAGERAVDAPSVLFAEHQANAEHAEAPGCFPDLNLDQVVEALTAKREEYELTPFFSYALDDEDTILYRQEVMRDVEHDQTAALIDRFAKQMRLVRSDLKLIGKLYYRQQREAWMLEAAGGYCEAVTALAEDLERCAPESRGLDAIRRYLAQYVQSEGFVALEEETSKLIGALREIRYAMTIRGGSIRVNAFDDQPDFGAQVEETFSRFRQGEVEDHRVRFASLVEMGNVEAAVLEFVGRLHPKLFIELADYCTRQRDFIDATITRFDREIQFYTAYLHYIEPIKQAGMALCYPTFSATREVHARETFDLALAHKLAGEKTPVVCNEWQLNGRERIFVISGPNQGGKTTFARTFGQLHYLARLGVPVPGAEAQLALCDEVFTHFEKQEDLSNEHGKLEDDLIRVHDILTRATARSVIVMNESFTSTSLEDALFLGSEVIKRMIALDVIAVYVTFVDELASLDASIVSATSTVDEHDPTIRTFKIIRRAADGLAYAMAIAEKYQLTYDVLRERVAG